MSDAAQSPVEKPDFVNPDLRLEGYRAEFDADKKTRVADFLQKDIAEKVALSMKNEVPWKFATLIDGEDHLYSPEQWRAMDPRKKQELLTKAATTARSEFHYAFNYYEMLAAFMENREPKNFLHDMAAFIRSEAFLEIGRQLTGYDDIIEADCQATLYTAGHYLKLHNDLQDRRRAAYVMGFTPTWYADWGGMLEFFDNKGDIISGFMPTFNSLTVFDVPQYHAVSVVAPYAGGPRVTITGWFLGE